MRSEPDGDSVLSWVLIYTKVHAETWADANLRAQGFRTLYPRVRSRGGRAPLFPRYLFVGYEGDGVPRSLSGTYGVQRVVEFAGQPAHVPVTVIADVAARMDGNGLVTLDDEMNPLFARRDCERVRVLMKLAQAGFRVRSA